MYDLPIWFLIVSLFLPRISLFIEWWQNMPMPFGQPWAALSWMFFPRLIILVMIYSDQGLSAWFWVHLVVCILVILGAGSRASSDD
jgi:hypothetical protein